MSTEDKKQSDISERVVGASQPKSGGQPEGEAQAAPPAAAAKGAKPSNTAPYGYIHTGQQEEIDFRLLRFGIDSLYVSYPGNLLPEEANALQWAKLDAQSNAPVERARAQCEVEGHIFEVSPRGREGYAFVIRDKSYDISLRAGFDLRRPVAYVKVSSEVLAHKPIEAILEELGKIISSFTEIVNPVPVVSRVDIYADYQTNADIAAIPREAWVTQTMSIDSYIRKNQFTGWVFGTGSSLSARHYNKTAEIEQKSHKTFFYALWDRANRDPQRQVWRMEFQFKREVINQFKIWDAGYLLDKLGGLWLYAVEQWLRLTIPTGDSNRARWPLHPIWEHMSAIRWRLDDVPLKRQYTPARIPKTDKLFRMHIALLVSYMTIRGIKDYKEGATRFNQEAREFMESWCRGDVGIEFEEWLEQKLNLKAREFNTRRNPRTVRQDATTSPEVEKNASDYYKASKGE